MVNQFDYNSNKETDELNNRNAETDPSNDIHNLPETDIDYSRHTSIEEVSDLNWEIHLEKAKHNKIYNTSYNDGNNLKDPCEYEYGKSLQIDASYSNLYMENYEPAKFIINNISQKHIESYIENNEDIRTLLNLNKTLEKRKFNKQEINTIFSMILAEVKPICNDYTFISIFDTVSKYTNINYKKLFDFLDYQYKELIILELNEEYNILNNYNNFNDFF